MIKSIKNIFSRNFREHISHEKIAGIILALGVLSICFYDYNSNLAAFFSKTTIFLSILWFIHIWYRTIVNPTKSVIITRSLSLFILVGILILLNIGPIRDKNHFQELEKGLHELAYTASYINIYLYHTFEDDFLVFENDKSRLKASCIPLSQSTSEVGFNNIKNIPLLLDGIQDVLNTYSIQKFHFNNDYMLFYISPYKGIRYYFNSHTPLKGERFIKPKWFWVDLK